jgi:hypothetical protein
MSWWSSIPPNASVELPELTDESLRTIAAYFEHLADTYGATDCDDPDCPATETHGGPHRHVNLPATPAPPEGPTPDP